MVKHWTSVIHTLVWATVLVAVVAGHHMSATMSPAEHVIPKWGRVERDTVPTCFRIDYANRPPLQHVGIVFCDAVEDLEPPTVEETNSLAQCLASTGKSFDMNVMAKYTFHTVDDIIGYPQPKDRVIIGYTDWTGKRIFVRRDMAIWGWRTGGQRAVLRHEVIHAITMEGPHDEGAFDVCSPKEFSGDEDYQHDFP